MTKSEQVRLWDAINRYVSTCNGDPATHIYSTARQVAVVSVETVIQSIERSAVNTAIGHALNSGDGSYKP